MNNVMLLNGKGTTLNEARLRIEFPVEISVAGSLN